MYAENLHALAHTVKSVCSKRKDKKIDAALVDATECSIIFAVSQSK